MCGFFSFFLSKVVLCVFRSRVISNLDVLHVCKKQVLVNPDWLVVNAKWGWKRGTVLILFHCKEHWGYLAGIQYLILLTAFKDIIKQGKKEEENEVQVYTHGAFLLNVLIMSWVQPFLFPEAKNWLLSIPSWRSDLPKYCMTHHPGQYYPASYRSSTL